MIVPAMSPINIAIERINPVVKILMSKIIKIVETAKIKVHLLDIIFSFFPHFIGYFLYLHFKRFPL